MLRISSIIIILLFVSITNSFSQTWKELNDKVIELFKTGDYAKAISTAEQAIEAAKKEFGEKQMNYASSLNNLALLYSSIGRYEKAEPLFVQAVEIGREISGKN